jgi:hypothetical protein
VASGSGDHLACDRSRQIMVAERLRWGTMTKALPVNRQQSLGVTNSPPLGSDHHYVRIMASADGIGEAL